MPMTSSSHGFWRRSNTVWVPPKPKLGRGKNVSNNVVYIDVKHMYHRDMPHPHHRGHRSRNRRGVGPGQWRVHARGERFLEPALLLILLNGSTHGHDLADSLAELLPSERIDMGNLYRRVRA